MTCITSISIPTLRTPCKMEPPATPPLRSSTSQPGLFTSNERITIIRGGDVKSLKGTGIFFVMYSHSTCEHKIHCRNAFYCLYWHSAYIYSVIVLGFQALNPDLRRWDVEDAIFLNIIILRQTNNFCCVYNEISIFHNYDNIIHEIKHVFPGKSESHFDRVGNHFKIT